MIFWKFYIKWNILPNISKLDSTKNNFRQKSFVFKDYPNTELFLNKNNNQLIKVSLNRTSYLFFSYLILILIFSIKIFYLSLFPEKKNCIPNNRKKFW